MDPVAALLDLQDGVISRKQALEAGMTLTEIARKRRRRDWVAVHPGVYVTHTGRLSWMERAWAAVLACWPAALDDVSALRAHEGPGRRGADDGPIHVVVAHRRTITAPEGVKVRRSRRFADAVQSNLSPPRLRYEHAVLDRADCAPDDLSAIAVVADARGGRRTTARRLRDALDGMSRVKRRKWLAAILDDVAEGTCSVLEHAYLTQVERAHGLPRGLRQVASSRPDGSRVFRDVVYGGSRPRWRQLVELDGRLHSASAAARDADLERDLDAAIENLPTVRLGYGQVVGRPCQTAWKVARLLQRRGWRGQVQRCANCPEDAYGVGFDQPG